MFKGSIVALVTPMLNGTIDVPRLRALVRYHLEMGTHGLVAAGTTGESVTLSYDEKLLVIKTVIDEACGRIPVIAGTAMNSTKDCIVLTQKALEYGAHAALIMTPATIRPTQEGLYLHYCRIAEAVPLPIILYNVPSRTGCDLLPETVGRLAKTANIIGIKEATGQIERLQDIMHLCQHHINVYSGDDLTAALWMVSGAKGVISVTANIAARLMAKLCDFALEGNESQCRLIAQQLDPLHELMFVESNPIPVKWALNRMGLITDEIRLPLTPLSKHYHATLEKILNHLELI